MNRLLGPSLVPGDIELTFLVITGLMLVAITDFIMGSAPSRVSSGAPAPDPEPARAIAHPWRNPDVDGFKRINVMPGRTGERALSMALTRLRGT